MSSKVSNVEKYFQNNAVPFNPSHCWHCCFVCKLEDKTLTVYLEALLGT